MAKIYPDTNWFVDFYQAALDAIDVFSELQKYKSSFVLTAQTVNEFRRNRVRTLKSVATQFRKSLAANPHTTSVLRALPGHSELTTLSSQYAKKGREVLKYLEQLIEEEQQDPVAQKFTAFISDPAVIRFGLTDAVIAAAHRRKLLGNPPSSPDKYTIGDEVIWEMLLANMQDDLIVLTRDHTFHENLSLLAEEFNKRTGRRLILVTRTLSEALKKVGEAPTQELIAIEKEEAKRLDSPPLSEFSQEQLKNMLNREICPRCGKDGTIAGFEGSDGDGMDWFECRNCGLFEDITGW
jgi:rRNA-processing protein FCF1